MLDRLFSPARSTFDTWSQTAQASQRGRYRRYQGLGFSRSMASSDLRKCLLSPINAAVT